MRTVLIFRYELLHLSETFIRAQAQALKSFHPCYIGIQRANNSVPVPGDSIFVLRDESIPERARRRLFLHLGWEPRFYRELRNRAPELVHAHFALDAAAALPLVPRLKIPLIVTLHGYDVTASEDSFRHGFLGPIYLKRKQELFRRASLFICISEFIRQKAIEAGFPESKLRVHYIGIDREFFHPLAQPRDPNLVIFVGRLIEQKGCRYLIEAMKIVQQKCAGAKLIVIGDGPARREFTSLAEESAISCQFVGAQPPEVVRDWLGRARVFCCPSITGMNGAQEGLGTVFTEAQAMGVPVVSSHIGGIPEAVRDGETGLLAPECDSKSLAQHILRYLSDDAFWRASSYRAVEWTKQRFDLQEQTRQLENIYQEVIDDAAGHHYRRPASALSAAAER